MLLFLSRLINRLINRLIKKKPTSKKEKNPKDILLDTVSLDASITGVIERVNQMITDDLLGKINDQLLLNFSAVLAAQHGNTPALERILSYIATKSEKSEKDEANQTIEQTAAAELPQTTDQTRTTELPQTTEQNVPTNVTVNTETQSATEKPKPQKQISKEDPFYTAIKWALKEAAKNEHTEPTRLLLDKYRDILDTQAKTAAFCVAKPKTAELIQKHLPKRIHVK